MISTGRSGNNGSGLDHSFYGDTLTLERPIQDTTSFDEYAPEQPAAVEVEDVDAAKERMSKNLEMLLNYEKYLAEGVDITDGSKISDNGVKAAAATVEAPVQQTVQKTVEQPTQKQFYAVGPNEDITPTSTTMQFGNETDLDSIYSDMRKETHKEKSSLNIRGKVLVGFYLGIVTIILALIVINTTLLASLRNSTAYAKVVLDETIENYERVVAEKELISSDEYVIDVAQSEYNMIMR